MFNFKKKEEKELATSESIISLDQKIEALLFYRGEEISLNFLSKYLDEKKSAIKKALEILRLRLKNSSLVLIENNNSFLLATRKEFSEIIKTAENKEENTDLSKSALETLSIILYKSPISKAVLDEIRGINSAYILRNLLIRGLVERKKDENKNVYFPTIKLLRFLGVDKKENLPAFQEALEKLEKIEESNLNLKE